MFCKYGLSFAMEFCTIFCISYLISVLYWNTHWSKHLEWSIETVASVDWEYLDQWEYIWEVGACKKMEFRENVWQHAELGDQGWTESLPGTQADPPSDHLLPVIWICQLPTIWISSSSNVDFIFRQYGFPSFANNQARVFSCYNVKWMEFFYSRFNDIYCIGFGHLTLSHHSSILW